jgi:hypothetical protein
VGEFAKFYDAEIAIIDLGGDDESHRIDVIPEGIDMRCPVCGNAEHGAEAVGDMCCDKCGNVIFTRCESCGKYMRVDAGDYITEKRGGDAWDYCPECHE